MSRSLIGERAVDTSRGKTNRRLIRDARSAIGDHYCKCFFDCCGFCTACQKRSLCTSQQDQYRSERDEPGKPALDSVVCRRSAWQQPLNSDQQRTAVCRDSQLNLRAAEAFESCECTSISQYVAARRDSSVIAAMLALLSRLRRNPPNRGMIEKQGLDAGLHEIDEIIVPANVSELVGEQRFPLCSAESSERARGQKDHRPQPTDDRRYFYQCRLAQANRPRNAKPMREPGKLFLPMLDGCAGFSSLKPLNHNQSARESQRQEEHSCKPQREEPGNYSRKMFLRPMLHGIGL